VRRTRSAADALVGPRLSDRARLGSGLVLALASILLAVLAVQVWRYPAEALRQDRLLRQRPGQAWAGDQGVAIALAGARDDVAFRRAFALFKSGRPDEPGGNKSIDQIVAGLESAILLARIRRGDGPAARRSRAANLEGIILGEDAIFEPEGGPRISRAAELFRHAIALDPHNDAAKANLELLYNYAGPAATGMDTSSGFGGLGNDAGAFDEGGGY
jgi:hypothetical protein